MTEMGDSVKLHMYLFGDNQAAIYAENSVLYDKSKHNKVDCHFIQEKVASKIIHTEFEGTKDQLADIFSSFLIKRYCIMHLTS